MNEILRTILVNVFIRISIDVIEVKARKILGLDKPDQSQAASIFEEIQEIEASIDRDRNIMKDISALGDVVSMAKIRGRVEGAEALVRRLELEFIATLEVAE